MGTRETKFGATFEMPDPGYDVALLDTQGVPKAYLMFGKRGALEVQDYYPLGPTTRVKAERIFKVARRAGLEAFLLRRRVVMEIVPDPAMK